MWATQQANQAWVTLRASRVVFSDLVRSDLRYSKAYHQCLGMCRSPVSSVCIESFRNMPQGVACPAAVAEGEVEFEEEGGEDGE